MSFFRRELGPVERFESALREKQTARLKLSGRSRAADAIVADKRKAAEKLAVAGAADAKLARAENELRTVEERAKTLRAELAEFDEQLVATEKALAEAKAQRERDRIADEIEAMAAAIEKAAPGFDAGAAGLLAATGKGTPPIAQAARFSASIDAVRREVLSAVELICWELRSAAASTRSGNANAGQGALTEPEQPALPDIARQLIYTLNPLQWREGAELRRVPAFAAVALPKYLLTVALGHQHADHMNARRVQTLMHVHGNAAAQAEVGPDDPRLVDLDALAAEAQARQADVA
ncbi:hypothetical protein [Bradyrhizobium sp.]|uniref:hypothetical protein n=1 Tax=Bradyrhizobium sp. TaxID=376 RepID=UPI001E0B15EB|nr:hypothetical protein [Bradyrhizobium sp.]MBI5319320.1 hypothetical protein [Bradyrhizobium sp.]